MYLIEEGEIEIRKKIFDQNEFFGDQSYESLDE
jgi:hypothetical protein